MALPATDSFTGTDGTLLPTYSASWSNVRGTHAIQGNACGGASSGDSAARWNADTFVADQYSQGLLRTPTNSIYTGLAVRCAAAAVTHYGFILDTDERYLYYYLANSYTELAAATGQTNSADAAIRLEATGTTITAIYAGSTWQSVTNATIASGSAGVASSAIAGSTSSRVDTWEGNDISAASLSDVVAIFRHRMPLAILAQ